MPPFYKPQRSVDIVRVRDGRATPDRDAAAVEEPLEIRLHGRPFVVIMRTPGADRELAAGFLLSEQIIEDADDLGTIEHCADGSDEHRENVLNVTLTDPRLAERAWRDRRQVTTTSACGMCGRRTIESLRARLPPLPLRHAVSPRAIALLPERLRAAQQVFDETGGLHAAGLFTGDGTLVHAAEDVGRHNAVDKIVGRMLMREALPLTDSVLFVSGRSSFEIVQKAFVAGIPIVAAVSAPSTLAIDLAAEAGVTLVGFVRDGRFNVYAHPGRIASDGVSQS